MTDGQQCHWIQPLPTPRIDGWVYLGRSHRLIRIKSEDLPFATRRCLRDYGYADNWVVTNRFSRHAAACVCYIVPFPALSQAASCWYYQRIRFWKLIHFFYYLLIILEIKCPSCEAGAFFSNECSLYPTPSPEKGERVTDRYLIYKTFDIYYTIPCAIIARATFMKPAMLAPFT